MATGPEWSCPICREASGNIAHVGSCQHQFCRGCIVRWVRQNPSCPLCRQAVHTIIYPAPPGHGFVEMAVPQPSVRRSAGPRGQPGPAGPQLRAHVAGFPPEAWALFFCNDAEILRPLERWMNEVLCGACWWDVAFAQGRIVNCLCRYGLHEEALEHDLQPFLQEQTAAFVQQLIEVAADQCTDLVLRRIAAAPGAAEGHQGGPAAGPGAGASTGPGTAQEEPGEQAGRAGPEASGAGESSRCVLGPSGRRRGGGSSPDSAGPRKKRCRRQK